MVGTPVEKFKMQKDLRKGDPLCPLLSIIVVEGLNWLYEKTNYKALIKDMQIGEDGLCVTHLLFTDDIDFLWSWHEESNEYKEDIELVRDTLCPTKVTTRVWSIE